MSDEPLHIDDLQHLSAPQKWLKGGRRAAHRHRWLAALTRLWLAVRFRLLDRRYGRLTLEQIDGLPFLVLPEVFNPVLLRSGLFLTRALGQIPLRPGAPVLDLGCGSGVGAVFAAWRGGRVTAVDINPEAVRCTRINALLNQYDEQIEAHQGDLFAPVAGRQFELILFNPPFHRGQPRNKLDYAWRGVDLFERFAAELNDYLAPDGRCLLILSSDGDCDELLALLQRRHFTTQIVAQSNLLNETLTAYLITTNQPTNSTNLPTQANQLNQPNQPNQPTNPANHPPTN